MHERHGTLDRRLAGKRVCICAGAGGVGKTTISAALALGLAADGAKVALLSIDPAKRLAQTLGLSELGTDPARIDPRALNADGVELDGELWAMMLDSKGTFDQMIARLAPDSRTLQEIYSNRIYRELSGALAGSQEFTALAKLYELDRELDFDVIVLDTPPSRNALDFLDSPTRLIQFLDGRAVNMFLSPGGLAARVLGRSSGLVFAAFARVTGIDLLGELSAFFRSLAGVLEGIRERVGAVDELLGDSATSFLIVTSPEPEPAAEAVFVHQRLAKSSLPFGALIVNRVHSRGLGGEDPRRLEELLSEELGDPLAARVAANLRDLDVLARRDSESLQHLCELMGEPEPVIVPDLEHDIVDLEGLAVLAGHLLSAPTQNAA